MFFKEYIKPDGIPTVLYYENENGDDWYEYTSRLDDTRLKILVNDKNEIVTWSYNASELKPVSMNFYEVDEVPKQFPSSKLWMYIDGKMCEVDDDVDYDKKLKQLINKIQYYDIVEPKKSAAYKEEYRKLYEQYIDFIDKK